MSLTEPRLIDIVKKQFRYKLTAYTGVFSSLLIMQLLGVFMGFNSGGGMTSSETLTVFQESATNDSTVAFTLIWALAMGILVTTVAHRNDAFSFVSNRLSHHLASFSFLLVISVIAGMTAVLAGSLTPLIGYLQNNELFITSQGIFQAPASFGIQIMTSILYTILLAGFGYAIGSCIQRSRLFIPVILVTFFVLPFWIGAFDFLEKIITFFGSETSFSLFLVKVTVTVTLFFLLSIAITTKLEVRK